MVQEGLMEASDKFKRWAYHRSPFGEITYLRIYQPMWTKFGTSHYTWVHSYVTVWKFAKSDNNHAFFPCNTILISIWCSNFLECKSSNNDCIETKLCTNNDFKVYPLITKNYTNRSKTVQAPLYRICVPQYI